MANQPPPPYNPQPPPVYQQSGQPAAYPPPGQGYPPPGQPAGAYPPPVQPAVAQPPTTTTVVVQGAGGQCPHCGVGYRTENYTTCGIILAICFFPLGIICCLLMKETKCSHCGQPM